MKRKASSFDEFDKVQLEEGLDRFKKLKIGCGVEVPAHESNKVVVERAEKATQTELKVYTEVEVQRMIRKLQSSDFVSNDNFGQTTSLPHTRI